MKTVVDLGREIKAKYPGKYDDMSDAELGRAIKKKYPQYSDYEDVAIAAGEWQHPSAPSIPTQRADLLEQVKHHYNPRNGRFTAWWKRGQADQRNKLLQVLNEEQVKVIERATILEEQILAGRKRLVEFEAFVTRYASELVQIRANEELILQALSRGLSVQSDQALRVESEMSSLRVGEAHALSEVKVREHRKLKDIDLNARWREIQQDSDAADLAQLGDYLLIKKLHQELMEAREKRHAIEVSSRPRKLKEELLADYDEFIARIKAKINERETGHIQTQNGKEARGAKAATKSRANYPPAREVDKSKLQVLLVDCLFH
jgi:hypothetical protein